MQTKSEEAIKFAMKIPNHNDMSVGKDSTFDQSLLANTTRTEHRDDGGELFYTVYDKLDPFEPASRSGRPHVIALAGIGYRGIGHSTAFEFSVNRGAIVVACDKHGERGARAAREINQSGGRVHFIEADVSTEIGVSRFLQEIANKAGRANALVCNAGSAFDPKLDTIRDLTLDQFHKLIDVNLTSALLTTQAALEEFLIPQREGAVVLLGSQNSESPVFSQLGYAMAKAGLRPLKNELILRYGGFLRVHIVRPGPVRTQSANWQERLKIDRDWEIHEARLLNPTGRLARPDEVASVIAWLAMDAPSHLNGLEVDLDGGFGAVGLRIGTEGRDSIVRIGRLLDEHENDERKEAA